jgi:prepilin-type N-terminal cleavage/methylation domain-containing protein
VTLHRGLTLLEVIVALVLLTLVGAAYLELFSQSHRIVGSAREWSDAVTYAQDQMEIAKLGKSLDPLPNGFHSRLTRAPWRAGYTLVTVSVFLPGGQRFDLSRVTKPDSAGGEDW